MDLSKLSTEELMKMRDGPDLSSISTEELMKMRGGDDPAPNPTGSFVENAKAGVGKVFYDFARGGGQMVRDFFNPSGSVQDLMKAQGKQTPKGLGDTIGSLIGAPTPEEIAETRKLEAPLMKTGGGITGNIVGGAALLAPAALIPGANTVTGAGITGGVLGALQPVGPDESRLKNITTGTAVGGGAQAALGAVTKGLQNRAAAQAAEGAQEQAGNAARDAALEAGRKAGYVVPPTTVNPSLKNAVVESVGGKIATEQSASIKNQRVTDALAREYLGMGENTVLSKASLADARKIASEPYRQITALSDDAAKALEAWKQANFEAKMQWTYFRKSGNPEAYAKAQELGKVADNALVAIENEAVKLGVPQMVESLKAARVKLAKIHTIESAMSKGHVDANVIAKVGERMPLDGPLKLVADFATYFPQSMKNAGKVGSPGVHAARSTVGAGIGTLMGGPVGTVAGAATGVAVPWAAREAMLSGAGQAAMATPRYATGAGVQRIADLLGAPANRAVLPAATVGSVLQYRPQ